ncbi:MAG: PTS transporter subunit EIIB [Bifidobacteriaceae bacterium]|nr:PTS transporter subunit EIIB [Bifidobacteriaceae bacterium]
MELAASLVERLGGAANITLVEPCAKRIRAEIANPALIDVPGLKALGAYGVVISGWVVQIVIGADTNQLVDHIKMMMIPQSAESAFAA